MEKNNLQKYKENILRYGEIKERGRKIKEVGKFIHWLYGGAEFDNKRLEVKKYCEKQEKRTVSQEYINRILRAHIDDFYLCVPQSFIPNTISDIKEYRESTSPELLDIVKDDLNSLEENCIRCLKFKKFDWM